MFVFGYGSLVSPESVALTLGRPVSPQSVIAAHLAGWRRVWNVGTDEESHPERTFVRQGVPWAGLAVVLGLEPGPGCTGAVFPVLREDLDLLDVRERNYRRIDVSEAVTWAGKSSGAEVHAYVPRDRAIERIRLARGSGREMAVRREYAELVERAFDSVGGLAGYRATTVGPPADMPLVSLDVVIRP